MQCLWELLHGQARGGIWPFLG